MVATESQRKGEPITVIWVVSKSICSSQDELDCRHQYIRKVTKAEVSPWSESSCEYKRLGFRRMCQFYICRSKKGEYGIVITAHVQEVEAIFEQVASRKRAIVVINSCEIDKMFSRAFLLKVKQKNSSSELFFAYQEKESNGILVNYADNVGTFGFSTTLSERLLFRHRHNGLLKAIRESFKKVTL